MDSNNVLPNSFTDVARDPRPNHKAAKVRLTKDEESVKKLNLHEYSPPGYTHYIFDDLGDEVDEVSNRKAYMEFINNRKGSAAMEIQDDVSTDSRKSIPFTPKKKSLKKVMVHGNEENLHKKVVAISIEDSEVSMMDEDESVTIKSSSLQKSGRRYRTKTSVDVERGCMEFDQVLVNGIWHPSFKPKTTIVWHHLKCPFIMLQKVAR